MEVIPFQSALAEGWDRLVARAPAALPGHDRRWPEALAAGLGHRPASLVALAGGEVRGILPLVEVRSWVLGRLLVSLPWLDAAGVLADGPEARDALLDGAVRLARDRRARSLEIRAVERYPGVTAVIEGKAARHLALTSETEVWERFDAKLRNQVRKAERAGLAVEFGGEDLLPEFHDPFSRNMRELGVPVWGLGFYRAILEAFRENGEVLVVRDAGRPVGGGLLIHLGGTALVPCASSLRSTFEKCPNHALYWGAIRRAIARGARRFDFGRSTIGSGPYRFKESWGGVAVPCRWHRPLEGTRGAEAATTASRRFRLLSAAWRRLPLPLTRVLGPRIVRHIP